MSVDLFDPLQGSEFFFSLLFWIEELSEQIHYITLLGFFHVLLFFFKHHHRNISGLLQVELTWLHLCHNYDCQIMYLDFSLILSKNLGYSESLVTEGNKASL